MKEMSSNGNRLSHSSKREVQNTVGRIPVKILACTLLVMVTAILTHAIFNEPSAVLAQPQGRELSHEALITHTQVLGDGTQQLCVLDPRQRVVAVYHIDAAKGAIALQSVRNIYWDLRINHFNGTTPLPEEIRSLIEQE